MMPLRFIAAVLYLLLCWPALAASPCGGEIPCKVANGSYRIELPADRDVRGVYVYFHGYKSAADLQMQQRYLVDITLAHHLAFVAVDGIGGSWSFPHAPGHDRDDQRFAEQVFVDLGSRFGFRPEQTVLGGFSIGASMAWYTACFQGERAAAMVTFSGVFWNPLPDPKDCTARLPRMVHFHGTADTTFPIAGRSIGHGFRQGNALQSIAIYRQRASCDFSAARKVTMVGISCEDVPGCTGGDSILCIHSGGHEARADLLGAGLTAVGYPQ